MWHWDQGHSGYFQFDALRGLASYLDGNDLKVASKTTLKAATGLSFAAPQTHSAWRNYSRVAKLCFLLSERDGAAEPTGIAALLAQPGAITCDEYFHFLCRAHTEPSSSSKVWTSGSPKTWPLLFSLKYLLGKASISTDLTSIDEVIGAYKHSKFTGKEDHESFLPLYELSTELSAIGATVQETRRRQARESIKVICQISYLRTTKGRVEVTLGKQDAKDLFVGLLPVGGPPAADREAEIRRVAALFSSGTDPFHQATAMNNVVESGFVEGSRAERTHLAIERNAGLRKAFFAKYPYIICDVCRLDSHASYPWADRILELHHLLPLSSGTRVVKSSTTFDDLVAVCPTCHRAVHRYYGTWFKKAGRPDFASRDEAAGVYAKMKAEFAGPVYA